ncbi:TetR family transcriptional regulator [Paenibacillus sp. CCS19]|uniref:TetR/AcrR family transcriptional regulator n=1 Tax=Paenibacillus sp. CCS19 TaxID=3158387 RepID=UPI0025642A1F|nr:TetR/AcrR family transcriptional regulator [Paenibacillus cellulosilyticus]GMK41210.1 TetR family transcriptional regulator [Paenibacillus cellulosilyticus]
MARVAKAQAEQAFDERREQIKRAALRIFAEKGLAGTKMSMIADEVGISHGLTYRYFSSKDEIFVLLVEEAVEEAAEAIRNIGQLPGTPLEQVRAFALRLLDESHRDYFLLVQQAHKSDGVPLKAKEAVQRYSPQSTIELLFPIFIRGQEAGQFAEGDPHNRIILFLSILTGLMLQDARLLGVEWTQEVDRLMRVLT